MSDIYKYEGLSEEVKQHVLTELNEDPKQVNAHIESFRRWVKSMPHLKCPTDSKFLLMFLRVAKFDHAKAQKRLDNFCTIRSSERGCPEFFQFPSSDDPNVERYMRTKQQVPLGQLKDGSLLGFGMLNIWDPKELPMKAMFPLLLMGMEITMQNEFAQIYGLNFFMDLHGCGKNIMEVWGDPKLIKTITRIWQDCYPVRIKGQVVYREPAWYGMIYNIMEFFLSEKHKKRVYRVKDDIQKAFEKIPGLQTILPKEYSGNGLTVDEYVEKWTKQFQEFYKNGSPWASISVDESKRPQETVKYLTQYADYKGESVGTEGTFTKFDVL